MYRNNPTEKQTLMFLAFTTKFFTQILPTWGGKALVDLKELGTSLGKTVIENKETILYTTTGRALAAYEISKHHVVEDLAHKDLSEPTNSIHKNKLQEHVYDVKVIQPHEKDQLLILLEIFPEVRGKAFA